MQTKQQVVFLQGQKVILRPIERDDIKQLVVWINDPEVNQYVTISFPMTEMAEEKWYESLDNKKDIVLGIEVDGELIGTMGIHGINWIHRTATTGAIIGNKNYWGKGYGTDAKMILLNYAFNTLNLRKILSSVYEFNKRSLNYSLHCGYKIEGKRKKNLFRNGKYWDEILLGVFKSDWLPYWRKYQKGLPKKGR
jgi:diamine N-acetyltransferase